MHKPSREEHDSPYIVEPGELPVEPDEGQISPVGVPADPEFEKVVTPPE